MQSTKEGRFRGISRGMLLRAWAIELFYGGGVAGLGRCYEFLCGQILPGNEAEDIECETMVLWGFDDGAEVERAPKNPQ